MITPEQLSELRRLESLITADCGDNSCRYAKSKGGMRTNGGCRCVDARDSALRLLILRLTLPGNLPAILDAASRGLAAEGMKEVLRDAHAAMGDALLAGGGLSQAYAHSVQRKIDDSIIAYDAACAKGE